jgi:hypothetical protein
LIVFARGLILSSYLSNPGGKIPGKSNAAGVPLLKDTNKTTKSRKSPVRLPAARNEKIDK